uniref:Uncharacterized protein n=1 Tax=Arundo donax TaxID=35708 RepID=A0A0A9BE13_ARUDO
MWSSIHMPD